MRIIKEKTVYTICQTGKYRSASDSLTAWILKVRQVNWASPVKLKETFPNASIIDEKRVVFNIRGNDFRLVVDVEYRLRLVFIIWFGTHEEYQKLNIRKLNYGNQRY
jgi:mRNA interferase HigB